MKLHPRVTRPMLELVKRFEGLRRVSAQLPDGGYTLGYGHVRTARPGLEIGPDDAEALLRWDLSEVAQRVEAWTFAPLTAPQFEALTALAFNIGLENFRRSAVLRHVNSGDLIAAADAFEHWRYAEVQGRVAALDALVRRRTAEKAHFLSSPEGVRATPTPVIRPLTLQGRPPQSDAGVPPVVAPPAYRIAPPPPVANDDGDAPFPIERADSRRSVTAEALAPFPSFTPPPPVEAPPAPPPPASEAPRPSAHARAEPEARIAADPGDPFLVAAPRGQAASRRSPAIMVALLGALIFLAGVAGALAGRFPGPSLAAGLIGLLLVFLGAGYLLLRPVGSR